MGKGIMFSITMVLVSSLLLIVSMIILNNFQATERSAMEFGIASSTNDLSSSLENSISNIFTSKSGMSALSSGNAVNISDILPSNGTAALNDSLNSLKAFVESKENNVHISIDSNDIIILPTSMRYISNSTLTRVIKSINNASSITLTFDVKNNTIGKIDWLSFSSGHNDLTVVYMNSSTRIISTNSIDFNGEILLELNSGARQDFSVAKASGKDLLMEYKNSVGQVGISSSISVSEDSPARAALANYIAIDHEAVGVSKVFYPRIM